MKTRLASLFLVLATGLAACGDDGDGGDPDAAVDTPDAGPTPAQLADVCDADSGAFVVVFGKFFDCFPEFEVILGARPTPAELQTLCEDSIGPFVEDGTVILGDSDDLAACNAFIEGLTCDTLSLDLLTPCDDLIRGTLDIGADCDDSSQCAGDSFCDNTGGLSCGVCAQRKPDGAGCVDADECSGRRCDQGGSCRALGQTGDACEVNDDCIGTQICDRATLQCTPEPAWTAGQFCAEFPFDCDGITGDLFCNPASLTCQSYSNLGDPCDPANPLSCKLFQFETCQDAGGGAFQCTAGTVGAIGADCGFFIGVECEAGALCIDDDGDPGTTSVCVRALGDGESCVGLEDRCAGLLECVEGACQFGQHTGMCPGA